jgi:epoxyqueuosine reductase
MNYFVEGTYSNKSTMGKVSRYAWSKDYHYVIWEKLESLITSLKKTDSSFEAISNVDTGPVMDKAWAVRSGLGWQGKHSNIINKQIGSWFLLQQLLQIMVLK